jgi:hypothetical protein
VAAVGEEAGGGAEVQVAGVTVAHALSRCKTRRSQKCERGTQECVRHISSHIAISQDASRKIRDGGVRHIYATESRFVHPIGAYTPLSTDK